MASYKTVKAAVIDVIDDFTKKDVAAHYSPRGQANFDAKTKLLTLAINDPVLAVMPIRFNKSLTKVSGITWKTVGSLDLVNKKTIGDLILLACGNSGTKVPPGEPT